MAKEWVLNIAFNRWQLNRPRYVGRVAEAIRACAPKSPEEWEQYYFREVPQKHVPAKWQMLGPTMQKHLEEVGVGSTQRFEEEKGGKVFIVFSVTEKGGRKRILNAEVIDQIRDELRRLTSDDPTSPHPG